MSKLDELREQYRIAYVELARLNENVNTASEALSSAARLRDEQEERVSALRNAIFEDVQRDLPQLQRYR